MSVPGFRRRGMRVLRLPQPEQLLRAFQETAGRLLPPEGPNGSYGGGGGGGPASTGCAAHAHTGPGTAHISARAFRRVARAMCMTAAVVQVGGGGERRECGGDPARAVCPDARRRLACTGRGRAFNQQGRRKQRPANPSTVDVVPNSMWCSLSGTVWPASPGAPAGARGGGGGPRPGGGDV